MGVLDLSRGKKPDGRLKDDNEVPGAFGNLEQLLKANPDLDEMIKGSGIDLSDIDNAREASNRILRSADAQMEQLLGVGKRIEAGEDFVIKGNKAWFRMLMRKTMGDRSQAEKLALIEIDKKRAMIGAQAAFTSQALLKPGKEAIAAMMESFNDAKDDNARNEWVDSTEQHFKDNPEEGHVIPWMAEAVRRGMPGIDIRRDVIQPPIEDPFYKNPAAAKAANDLAHNMGVRSVSVDGTVNDGMLEWVEGLINIPGISENAADGMLAQFLASQKQALAQEKKDFDEETKDQKIEGIHFAVADSGVRHTSTDSTDWRVDAGKDFENFRIFTALQKVGIVARESLYTRDWDMMSDMRRLSDTGATIADLRERPEIWDESTARGLDYMSGTYHTPFLIGEYVGTQDPDLLQRLKEHPEYKNIIGLEHMPSSGLDPDGDSRSDLRNRTEDVDRALGLLDDADKD